MKNTARIAIIIVFLALIRCLGEFFRLKYYQGPALSIASVAPFILDALICAVSCLMMTISLFYSRYRLIVVISVCTIITLFVIKWVMM